MHILVAHGSHTDGTARIAHAIGERLESRGMLAPVVESCDVLDTSRYNAIVVGSSLCSGKWISDCVKLLKQLAKEDFIGPVWLFHSTPIAEEGCADAGLFPKHVIVYADRLDVRDWVTFGDPTDATNVDEWFDRGEVEAWADQIASVVTDELVA